MNRIDPYHNKNNGYGTRTSDDIRKDVENTRQRMDGRLDRIASKVSPSSLGSSVSDSLSNAIDSIDFNEIGDKISEAGASTLEAIKKRPLPFALGVLALASVFVPARSREEDDEYEDATTSSASPQPQPFQTASYRTEPSFGLQGEPAPLQGPETVSGTSEKSGFFQSAKESASSAAGRVSDAAHSGKERISEAAHRSKERISEAAHHGKESVKSAGQRASHWVDDTSHRAADGLRRGTDSAKRRFENGRQSHPEALALGALAVGVIGAILLPRTRTEDEWYGDQSKQLRSRAKDAGKQFLSENHLDKEGLQARARQGLNSAEEAAEDAIDNHVAP